MDNLVPNQQLSDIEKTISQIEGIEAARIVANGQGIEEIHVLSTPRKNVKQLARDIESALMAKHGLAIDYRKISIAQIATEEQSFNSKRLKLKSVNIETSSLNCLVSITLSYNEKDYEGVANGSCSGTNKQKLIAEATLKAVEKVNNQLVFSLEGLEVVSFGAKKVVCTCISLNKNGNEMLCTGSALKVEGSENEAIVKAVLSAINRRFSNS